MAQAPSQGPAHLESQARGRPHSPSLDPARIVSRGRPPAPTPASCSSHPRMLRPRAPAPHSCSSSLTRHQSGRPYPNQAHQRHCPQPGRLLPSCGLDAPGPVGDDAPASRPPCDTRQPWLPSTPESTADPEGTDPAQTQHHHHPPGRHQSPAHASSPTPDAVPHQKPPSTNATTTTHPDADPPETHEYHASQNSPHEGDEQTSALLRASATPSRGPLGGSPDSQYQPGIHPPQPASHATTPQISTQPDYPGYPEYLTSVYPPLFPRRQIPKWP